MCDIVYRIHTTMMPYCHDLVLLFVLCIFPIIFGLKVSGYCFFNGNAALAFTHVTSQTLYCRN